MEEMLKLILSEVKSMRGQMNSMQNQINSIQTEVNSIKSEVKSIREELDIIHGRIDEHHDLLDALEHRVEENTAHLMAIGENVNYIRGDIARINTRLDYQGTEICKCKEEIYVLKNAASA